MAKYKVILTAFLGFSLTLLSSTVSHGRPIADSSAGTKVRVKLNDDKEKVFVVQDGTVVGNRLFHSFKAFSIPEQHIVRFTLPPSKSIKTVFSRVTGKSISHLHGKLRVSGNTNLVFLNPNGIVFHEDFNLSIQGSFLATTAESILFKDGDRFSSSLTNTPSLLKLSVPIGLQFGENPGTIQVLAGNDQPGFANGLQVKPGQDIALMGGDIQIETGKVIAPGGNIWLDSVSESSITEWKLGKKWNFIPQGSPLGGEILIHKESRLFSSFDESKFDDVEKRGDGINGQISFRGGQITIENSILNAENRGASPGAGIHIDASQTIDISVLSPSSLKKPSLTTQPRAKGKGGMISLTAQDITITSESQLGDIRRIVTDSVKENRADVDLNKVGKSGNIKLIADQEITLQGGSAISSVSSAVQSMDSAGAITIKAKRLNLLDGSQIRTSSRSSQQGGDLTVDVDEKILLSGFIDVSDAENPVDFRPSGLVTDSNSENTGEAGAMTIRTPILRIENGAAIGDAVLGRQGEGIRIKVEKLELINGGQIGADVTTIEEGIAGNIQVDASKYILISGKVLLPNGTDSRVSQIQVNTNTDQESPASDVSITLKTPLLLLLDNAMISANSKGSQGGKIALDISDLIFLGNSSRILSDASSGAGGEINIKGSPLIISPPGSDSNITANSDSGPGGRITINSLGIEGFRIIQSRQNPDQIKALSQNGINDIAASSGNPNLQGEVVINNPNSLRQDFVQLETPLDESSNMEQCQNSQSENSSQFRLVGQGGMVPSSPANIDLWDDTRTPTESLFPSPSMTIEVPRDSMPQEPLVPIIQASGWVQDHTGQIALTANIPNPHLEKQYQASKSCHSLG